MDFSRPLRLNPNQDQRYGRYAASLPHDVVEFAFVVCHSGAHLALERFHREDFDAYIDLVPNIERKVLHE